LTSEDESDKPVGRRLRFKAQWVRHPVQAAFLVLSWAVGSEAVREVLKGRLGLEVLPEGLQAILTPVYEALSLPLLSFGALQAMFSEPYFPWLPLGVIILMGLILGRAFCGWACPFGLVMDILSYLRRRHASMSARTQATARKIKYLVLGLTLIVSGGLGVSLAYGGGEEYRAALGATAAAPYYSLSPATTLFVLVPQLLTGFQEGAPTAAAATWEEQWKIISATPLLLYLRLAITVFTIAGAVYVTRFWCRYFCPLGGLISVFSRVGFMGLRRDPVKCEKCHECVEKCPMAVRILDLPWEKFTDADCTMCLVCRDACPRRAIRPRFS